ncbi:MAG: radical SAM protein [Clostridia bacterium]|nr:radical SAM protein [Clostridia bacterium]
MRIKLIQPKMLMRPMDTGLKLHMAPPLGLYTAAQILRYDHEVTVENENIAPVELDDSPDAVGISVTVDALPRAMEISAAYRSRGIPVIAGGIHITTAYETVPEDAFDALCIGCAEGTWPEIVKDIERGELKKRYFCPPDIKGSDIVSPAYDMIRKHSYLFCNVVHTSRGCPYRCDFCYNSSGAHRFMKRPIGDVLRDIEAVGMKHVMFIDDNLTGDREWAREFFRRITPLGLKWNAAVSIDAARDPELLDLMKQSGCRSLFIGFESVDPASIGSVHKRQNLMQPYETAVEEIHKRGIMINASFVFGLDGDTKDTFGATLDWIVKNRIETVTSHILTPYPGTVVCERMKAEGRITSFDLSKYNTAHVVFKPAGMTAEELYEGYTDIYKRIYSIKNIIRRMPKARDQRAAYLLFNLVYRKYGKLTDAVCRLISYERIGRFAQWAAGYKKRRAHRAPVDSDIMSEERPRVLDKAPFKQLADEC